MSDWKLVADCFGMDFRDVLLPLLPDLEVDAMQLRMQPTTTNPLGTGARLKMQQTFDYRLNHMILLLDVDGEQTPWLSNEALRAYALIQWPALFRVRTHAWNTAPA